MPQATYQTVRLSRGKHHSPDDGVCVMELASMLGGEEFTDRPACVSPVVGGFLRSYNDRIDDDRRQDFYEYAAKVVGTAAAVEVEARRAARCVAWAREVRPPRRRLAILRRDGGQADLRLGAEAAGVHAARAIRRFDDETHRRALLLVDELVSMGSSREAPGVDIAPLPAAEPESLPVG